MAVTRHWICQGRDHGVPSLQNREKWLCVVDKPPSWLYSCESSWIFSSCSCHVKTLEDHNDFLLLFEMYQVTPNDKRCKTVIWVILWKPQVRQRPSVPSPSSQTVRARKDGNGPWVLRLPVHLSECVSFLLGESVFLMAGPRCHTFSQLTFLCQRENVCLQGERHWWV